MENLIIELYKNKINFKYQYGLLIVRRDWNCGREYNKVMYNHYNDGMWHIEHYYRGYWYCEPFKTMEEVLQFFKERELD